MTTATSRTCRHCGCTDDQACPQGCSWVEPDLCSSCADEHAESDDVVPAHAFAIGVLVCTCGMRMQPAIAPTTAAELAALAGPQLVDRPGPPSPQASAAAAVSSHLQAAAGKYRDLLGFEVEPEQLEAWICPSASCRRVLHVEAYTPPRH